MPLSPFTEAQIIQFVNYEYSNFDWAGMYIPTDLQNRGFPVAELDTNAKYHNYGYGRCINATWNVLHKFVSTVLTQHYTGGDAQVAGDGWLGAFCAEMQSPLGGKMTKFPDGHDARGRDRHGHDVHPHRRAAAHGGELPAAVLHDVRAEQAVCAVRAGPEHGCGAGRDQGGGHPQLAADQERAGPGLAADGAGAVPAEPRGGGGGEPDDVREAGGGGL